MLSVIYAECCKKNFLLGDVMLSVAELLLLHPLNLLFYFVSGNLSPSALTNFVGTVAWKTHTLSLKLLAGKPNLIAHFSAIFSGEAAYPTGL